MSLDHELQRAAAGLNEIDVVVPPFERVAGRRRRAERIATVVASVLLLGGSAVAWQLGSATTSTEPGAGPAPCNELLHPDELPPGLAAPTFSDPDTPPQIARTTHCIWPSLDGGPGLGLHILEFDTAEAAQRHLADDAARFPNRVDEPNGFSATLAAPSTTAGLVQGTVVLFADGSIPAITPADDLRFVQLAATRLAQLP